MLRKRQKHKTAFISTESITSKITTARGGGFAMFAPERRVAPRLGLVNLVFTLDSSV
jgi:hypothetical protein